MFLFCFFIGVILDIMVWIMGMEYMFIELIRVVEMYSLIIIKLYIYCMCVCVCVIYVCKFGFFFEFNFFLSLFE